jgi:Ferritin-like protein
MSKLFEELNDQMNFELESAFIYAAMAAYTEKLNMRGMTHFLEKQSKEEISHGMKLKKFLIDVGYGIKYSALNPGDGEYSSVEEVFKKALSHEKVVTSRINALVRAAKAEDDQRVLNLLTWFVDEQIEEEDTFSTIVERFERIGGSWNGLYIFDGELGQR